MTKIWGNSGESQSVQPEDLGHEVLPTSTTTNSVAGHEGVGNTAEPIRVDGQQIAHDLPLAAMRAHRGTPSQTILVSFDIDGTLETGDPPGPLSLDLVRHAKRLGYVVGSASDRTVASQQRMWDEHQIDVDFVGHKHHLAEIIGRFDCQRHIHIGDTDVDRHYATLAGLEFHYVQRVPQAGADGWIF